MPTAFVLADVAQGEVAAAVEDISEFEDVTEVYSIAGDHDLLVKVQVTDYDQFADVIPDRLATVDAIEGTETLMSFKTHKL